MTLHAIKIMLPPPPGIQEVPAICKAFKYIFCCFDFLCHEVAQQVLPKLLYHP